MTIRKILATAATAAIFLFPSYSMAQEDELLAEETSEEKPVPLLLGEIEVGVVFVTEDSFKFGEFSGLEDEGAHIIGSFNVVYRSAADSDVAEYWLLTGSNLGLESRSLRLDYGQQGKFNIYVDYDQIPKFLTDDARTPFIIGNGGTELTLPAGWVPGDRNTREMTELFSSLNDVNIEHERKKFGGGFSWFLRKNFKAQASFHRESKEGTRTIGAIFAASGGNPASSIVPEPIDYETDKLDLVVSYAGKKGKFELGYYLSVFRNDNTSFTFENPYTASRWAPSASFPTGVGQIGLPPDNKAHEIRFSGSYILGKSTRATANLSYGLMTQNGAFLPFTIDPDLVVNTPLPRLSLDGEIQTILVNLAISSRPTPKLNVRASYRFQQNDNNTPRDTFLLVRSDSTDQVAIDSVAARINLPYGRKQHVIELDATYRLWRRTKLKLEYEYEQLERTFTEVRRTREHKLEAKIRSNHSAKISGWVGLEYASRTGSEYIDNAAFLAGHTPEHIGPNPEEEFENHPLLRKFFIADKERIGANASATFIPNDKVALGVSGHFFRIDYNETEIGLTETTTASLNIDLSYYLAKNSTAHAFYTFEALKYEQTGLSHRNSDLDNFAGRAWTANTDDMVNSIGIGVNWSALDDKLDVGLDYIFSRTVTDIDLTAGTLLSVAPLPRLKTRLHSFNCVTEYRYNDNMSVRLRYLYQKFDTTDFALDGIAPDTMRFVMGLGDSSPDYNVHVIGVSSVYRF